MIGAQIGQPVPAEDAFNADDDVFDRGKDQFENGPIEQLVGEQKT